MSKNPKLLAQAFLILCLATSMILLPVTASVSEEPDSAVQPRTPENRAPFDEHTPSGGDPAVITGDVPWNKHSCPDGTQEACVEAAFPLIQDSFENLREDLAPTEDTFRTVCSNKNIRKKLFVKNHKGKFRNARQMSAEDCTASLIDDGPRIWAHCWGSKKVWARNCWHFANARADELGLPRFDQVCGCPRWHSCFAPGTKLTLEDKSLKAAEDLAVGDILWNPILKKGVAIREIVEGPENIDLVQIHTEGKSLTVTQGHPVLTKRGLKRAAELSASDVLQSDANTFHSISRVSLVPPIRNQRVINFVLDAPTNSAEEHFLLSEGVVTGDNTLQAQMNNYFSGKQ